mgnify:CR=1 FL=1
MSALLQEIKSQALQITHLNNEEKAKHMNQNDCGWEDILNKAEDLYKEQMVDGLERWPPACNTRDSKAPPSHSPQILVKHLHNTIVTTMINKEKVK